MLLFNWNYSLESFDVLDHSRWREWSHWPACSEWTKAQTLHYQRTRLSPPHTHMSHAPPPQPHKNPPFPYYMHTNFSTGTSYDYHNNTEYDLNALRHEVADLCVKHQSRNDQEVERGHQAHLNHFMVRHMHTWMVRHVDMPSANIL